MKDSAGTIKAHVKDSFSSPEGLNVSNWEYWTQTYVTSLRMAINEREESSKKYSKLETFVDLATRAFKSGENLELTGSDNFKRLNQDYDSLLTANQHLLNGVYTNLMRTYLASFKRAIDGERKDEAEIFDNRLACFFEKAEQLGWGWLPIFTKLNERYDQLRIEHYNVVYC